MQDYKVKELAKIIGQIRYSSEELKVVGDSIETVKRNADSILAFVRILEINISDIEEFVLP